MFLADYKVTVTVNMQTKLLSAGVVRVTGRTACANGSATFF